MKINFFHNLYSVDNKQNKTNFNTAGTDRYPNLAPLKADLVSFGARKSDPLVLVPTSKESMAVSNIKMFQSSQRLSSELGQRLGETKNSLPEKLYNKLKAALSENDFDLKAIYTDYYKGLSTCKTLKQVQKKYPELVLPKAPRDMAKDELREYIKPVTYINAKEMKAYPEEMSKYLDYELNEILSDKIKESPFGSVMTEILQELKQEIMNSDFENIPSLSKGKNKKYAATTKLTNRMLVEDVDKISLDILKKEFIKLQMPTNISVKFADKSVIQNTVLKNGGYEMPEVPSKVRKLLNASEAEIERFEELANSDPKTLEKKIKANAIKISKADSDFKCITKKHWKPIRAILEKLNNPQETQYSSTALINTYLLSLFEAGKTVGIVSNPFASYVKEKDFNLEQKHLIENVYENLPNIDSKQDVLKSEEFKKFKKQFDITGMRSSVAKLETRYRQGFFKWFWTPERKSNYKKAEEESRKIIEDKTTLYNDYAKKNEKLPSAKKIRPKEEKPPEIPDDDALLNDLIKAEQEEKIRYENEFERLYDAEQMKLNRIKSTVSDCFEQIKENKNLLNYFYQYCPDEITDTNRKNAELFIQVINESTQDGKIEEKKAESIFKYYDVSRNFSYLSEKEQEFFLDAEEKFTDHDMKQNKEKIGRYIIDSLRYDEVSNELQKSPNSQDRSYLEKVNKLCRNDKDFDLETAGKLLELYQKIPPPERPDLIKFINSNDDVVEDLIENYKSHVKSKIDTFIKCEGGNGAVYQCVFTAKLKNQMLKKNFSFSEINRFERRMGKMTESASSTPGVILLQTSANSPIYEVKVKASSISDSRVIGRRDKSTQRIIFSELSMNAHSGSEIMNIARRLDKDGGRDEWVPEKLLNCDKEAQTSGEKILKILEEI